MNGENFPLGPGQRGFVGKEHFPGHHDDEDFDLTAEERGNIVDEKNAIEDAILDNIDNPYSESAEFEEEMKESDKIQKQEEEKSRGWKTNFQSASGDEYPTESEAEIIDTAIKSIEKDTKDTKDGKDHEELEPLVHHHTDKIKEQGKRYSFPEYKHGDKRKYRPTEIMMKILNRNKSKEQKDRDIKKFQKENPKN